MRDGDGPGVRVVVADVDPLVRLGVRAALSGHDSLVVVGEAVDGRGAAHTALATRADVVLLDPTVAREGMRAVDELALHAAVVLLTHVTEPGTVARAIEAGASGYLVHGTFDLDQLVTALLDAAVGQPCASPVAAAALVEAVRRRAQLVPGTQHDVSALSARERELMRLAAQGLSNESLGRRMGLTPKTVQNYFQNVYAKLGVHSKAAALAVWLGTAAVERSHY